MEKQEKDSDILSTRKNRYRPEIDGLRAVAVLGVILFHAELGVSGGFIGVDVFFVISGYLITGILLREYEQGEFSFLNFWKRRIKRIFPASVFVMLTVFICCYFSMHPLQLRDLGKSLFAQSFFSSNIYFWSDTGYFSDTALSKPFLHMWSLAIEEQFYLLLPPILYLSLRRSRTFLTRLLLVFTITSFFLNVFYLYIDQNKTFYWLPFRA